MLGDILGVLLNDFSVLLGHMEKGFLLLLEESSRVNLWHD